MKLGSYIMSVETFTCSFGTAMGFGDS